MSFMKSILVGTACAAMMTTTASADGHGGPYAEYAGTTLVINVPSHPHYNAMMKVLPEFTKETGIRVEVDQLQYLKMRERQTLELTKNKGDYDMKPRQVFHEPQIVGSALRRRRSD
jgi:multiple sugar transport system substrate-binding protein